MSPKTNPKLPSDEEVLKNALRQVLKVDLTRYTGWREGTDWIHPNAGKKLIARGILISEGTPGVNRRLTLSEAALVRAFRVAVSAAVADLLDLNPPEEGLPWEGQDREDDSEVDRLILCHDNTIQIRGR